MVDRLRLHNERTECSLYMLVVYRLHGKCCEWNCAVCQEDALQDTASRLQAVLMNHTHRRPYHVWQFAGGLATSGQGRGSHKLRGIETSCTGMGSVLLSPAQVAVLLPVGTFEVRFMPVSLLDRLATPPTSHLDVTQNAKRWGLWPLAR